MDELQAYETKEGLQIVIERSQAMGCNDVVGPNDLVKNNPSVNLLFLAEIFNCKHGLEKVDADE